VPQPDRPKQRIIAFLIEKQLATMSQARVNLAVLIDVGSNHPRARGVVEVEDGAFADVDEEANVLLTFEHVLLCAADV